MMFTRRRKWRVPAGEEPTALDKKVMALEAKGAMVPKRTLIRTPEEIEGIKKSGVINTAILNLVGEKIHAGMSTLEINDLVHNYTIEHGAIPATLGYEGYPKSVCVSVNEVVCHGIPSAKEILKEGDIVNVDCTTIVDGFYGDASRMFTFGPLSPAAEKLVRVTKESVEIAVEHLYPCCHLGDVGFYIDRHARKNGFSVVREIGGHGCGLKMHEEPYVCHIGKKGKGMVLVPGMIFTIEPMINEGSPLFTVDKTDGWQVRTIDGGLSAQVEHMILITQE